MRGQSINEWKTVIMVVALKGTLTGSLDGVRYDRHSLVHDALYLLLHLLKLLLPLADLLLYVTL